MSKKTKILSGHVHRLVDGVLETHKPGDPVPDWVTNPDLIVDGTAAAPEPTTSEPDDAGGNAGDDAGADDSLDSLSIKDLRELAEKAGVAKSGSKKDIIARLTAKAAVDAENDDENEDEGDADRDALIARVKELGIDVDFDNVTDVELQTLIEQE